MGITTLLLELQQCLGFFERCQIFALQVLDEGEIEPALITAGNDVSGLGRLFSAERTSYRATDVIAYLLGQSD